jgi:Transglycosylase SLT domain
MATINDAGSSVEVPAQYEQLIEDAAAQTGIPYPVVAAQVQDESGYNPQAVSSQDAEGMFQFIPSTYDAVARQAGVQPGTEFNPADEEKAYVVYMNELLQEEGGSIQKALEAYNAGPGNLAGGAGYADTILAAAGENPTATAGSSGTVAGNGTQTTSVLGDVFDLFGVPIFAGSVANVEDQAFADITGSMWQSFMGATGIGSFKDFMIRCGLLLLGFVIFITALMKFLDVHPVQYAASTAKSAAKEGLEAAVIA